MSIATASPPVFTRLSPLMAIAVEGIDLNRAPDPGLFARLRRALLDHQVLCIRGQDIGPAAFLAGDQSVWRASGAAVDPARAGLSRRHDIVQ